MITSSLIHNTIIIILTDQMITMIKDDMIPATTYTYLIYLIPAIIKDDMIDAGNHPGNSEGKGGVGGGGDWKGTKQTARGLVEEEFDVEEEQKKEEEVRMMML